jgi:acyl-CoA synthetase (AMP-forming)/AMP-acid ligase II
MLRQHGAEELVYLGVSTGDFAVALFAAAWAGIPLVPLNYRLGHDALATLLAHHPQGLVVSDLHAPTSARMVSTAEWRSACAETAGDMPRWRDDPDTVAVLLYTSGTTSDPKAAILRQGHIVSYLLGTVDFAAAGETEAALVSVPPYHIAGVSNLLSNIYAGRRVVYLPNFTPLAWLEAVRTEKISHALLVPTMLAGITEQLSTPTADVPTLRSLAYGLVPRCPFRCWNGRSGFFPAPISSTPTGSPKPAPPLRFSAPTITAPRCREIPWHGLGSGR